MMVETAVELVSLETTALNVNVLVDLLDLELLTLLEMAFVMMKSTMQNATMMVVTAVLLQIWLPMVSAMMKLMIEYVPLMVETAVYPMQTQIIVLILDSSHHLDTLETIQIILTSLGSLKFQVDN